MVEKALLLPSRKVNLRFCVSEELVFIFLPNTQYLLSASKLVKDISLTLLSTVTDPLDINVKP